MACACEDVSERVSHKQGNDCNMCTSAAVRLVRQIVGGGETTPGPFCSPSTKNNAAAAASMAEHTWLWERMRDDCVIGLN